MTGEDPGGDKAERKIAPHVDAPGFDRATYPREVQALGEWVEGYLVPVWVHSPSATAPWCTEWPRHRDAVSVLHALWLSWRHLIDTEQAGSTGPMTWITNHLNPGLAYLRAPKGPFAACMRGAGRSGHRLPGAVGKD